MKTPNYSTKLFKEIYPCAEDLIRDYKEVGIPTSISDENVKLTYFLIYSKHGNDPIVNQDENQFKYRLFTTIFQFGPTWSKRLDIQDKLRNLSEQELMDGSAQIYNHAFNDASENPSTSNLNELPYINEQNTAKRKRSKVDALGLLWDLLRTDVTENYARQFDKLFKKFVRDEDPTLYTECNDSCEVTEEVDVNGY